MLNNMHKLILILIFAAANVVSAIKVKNRTVEIWSFNCL